MPWERYALGLGRLAFLDRPTGQVIRRFERDRPGELVHLDVKKLGRIPDGGGHKVLGRQAGRITRSNMGFDYVHSAVDDHTRLAYSEVHGDERAATCAAFLARAAAFFKTVGIDRIERVLADEWAYIRPYTSNDERASALPDFLTPSAGSPARTTSTSPDRQERGPAPPAIAC